MQGLPFTIVTNRNRELLPHVFTLTPIRLRRMGAVIFCGPVCSPHFCGDPVVNRCIALRCPDFPPRLCLIAQRTEAIAWLIVEGQKYRIQNSVFCILTSTSDQVSNIPSRLHHPRYANMHQQTAKNRLRFKRQDTKDQPAEITADAFRNWLSKMNDAIKCRHG